MLQKVIKQFMNKTNIIYKKYPPCGRNPCQCLRYLNLNNKNDIKTYLDCYDTWYNYNIAIIHHKYK